LISHAQRFDDTATSLARTLIKLGTQLGHPAVGGVEIPHYVRQEDLAEMIGASREVVSSLPNRLPQLQLVEYRRKGQLLIRQESVRSTSSRAVRAGH
jgi:CRP/FNR family cyclic AMP-dependent transcriptional regulator